MNDMQRALLDQIHTRLVGDDPELVDFENGLAQEINHLPRRIRRMLEMAHFFGTQAIVLDDRRLMAASMAVLAYAGLLPLDDNNTIIDALDIADRSFDEMRAVADSVLSEAVNRAFD